jgi:hypothetical protein
VWWQVVDGPIAAGLLRLRDDHSIEAIYYQDDMPEWPDDQQQYTLVMRLAGSGVHVDKAPGGGFIWATAPPPAAAAVNSGGQLCKIPFDGCMKASSMPSTEVPEWTSAAGFASVVEIVSAPERVSVAETTSS